jgi:hypothetical protein
VPSLGCATHTISEYFYLLSKDFNVLIEFLSIFERHHRFIGWLGLFSTCSSIFSPHLRQRFSHVYTAGVFVILGDSFDDTTRTWNPNGIHLVHQQDFWFAMGMTTFIAIPWFTVREVPVDIELVRTACFFFVYFLLTLLQPSPKVAILRFKRGMQQGLLGRISRSSIMEYHAFGIIS